MKLIALIPAKSNSRRLPGKNIKLLNGKPLFVRSIEICKNIKEVSEIVVSTDSKKIANLATKFGAKVFGLRPKSLTKDNITNVEVSLDTLNNFKCNNIDGLLLLQPTSPFRTERNIKDAIKLYKKNNKKPVISVTKVDLNLNKYFVYKKAKLIPFLNLSKGSSITANKQNFIYKENGSIYLIHIKDLKKIILFILKVTSL